MTKDLNRHLNHPTTFLGRKLLPRGVGSFDFTTDCGNFYVQMDRKTGSYNVQLLVGGLPIWELQAPSAADAEGQMLVKALEIAKSTNLLKKSLTEKEMS